MAWDFIVTDLLGVPLGQVKQAAARKVTLPHLRIPSASFTLSMHDPLAVSVLDTDTLLKCYRIDPLDGTRSLAFHGPIVSAEETADGGQQNIAVTAAGPFWRVTKRLIPASKIKAGFSQGSASSLIDLGTIAATILADVNGVHFTGIDGATANGAQHTNSVSGWIDRWYLKNAAEGIAELAAGLSSFEFRVRPTEAVAYANPQNWPRIGLFDRAPVLGASRPDAVFEYGTTRANVASYSRSKSRDGLLTQAVISVQGWPDAVEKDAATGADKYNLLTRNDATAVSTRGLFEEVISDAGILDDSLRQKIADYHVLLRKQPRENITFRPVVNARPAPLIDYDVGDTVRARAVVEGTVRFDALFRVWGITFDVDVNGNENVELELVIP